MNVFQHYKEALKNYADFDGRARRMEFWSFHLVNTLIYLGLSLILLVFIFGSASEEGLTEKGLTMALMIGVPLISIYWLLMLIPRISVSVRRLHDSGKSGWFYLIFIIPFGVFVLLIFFLLESEKGINKWGPNPKGQLPLYTDLEERWLHIHDKDLV